jgi:hypothetical protein
MLQMRDRETAKAIMGVRFQVFKQSDRFHESPWQRPEFERFFIGLAKH